MKKYLIYLLISIVIFFLLYQFKPIQHITNALVVNQELVKDEGKTIASRVLPPIGYKRTKFSKGSFQSYLQNYSLKSYGSKIINYDGSTYYWQSGHIGILDVPVPRNGLQQCADALIRIRSEYLWKINRKEKIGFNFTSGHYCSWKKYAEGYRPKIKGNKVNFYKTATPNYSKTTFYKYLNLIFAYSGTLSLYNELPKVKAKDLRVGDMLILGGTPGHIVMLADKAVNEKGEKVFLLFQGNTPAQSVHLVKNLEDSSISPWYKLEDNKEVSVSNYTFSSSKFVRFK